MYLQYSITGTLYTTFLVKNCKNVSISSYATFLVKNFKNISMNRQLIIHYFFVKNFKNVSMNRHLIMHEQVEHVRSCTNLNHSFIFSHS